jgi:DNA-binding NarL/FixJ family response regulator
MRRYVIASSCSARASAVLGTTQFRVGSAEGAVHEQRLPDPTIAHICRVLVAASDQRMRAALRALVEADGSYNVVAEAHAAGETVVLDTSLRPALILLDLLIPTARDGLDAVRVLALGSRRPIVVISAQTGLRHAALAAGAAGFVVQGEGAEVLLGVLAAVRSQVPPASS